MPLGTAGSVKNAASAFDDSFIVISGDTVCDFDLREIMRRHRHSGAEVSVVCTRVSSPTEYGTVLTDGEYISAFVEKPSWRRILTDLVNTGIYVLNPSVLKKIGEGTQDFAADLFPRLLSAGIPIHCIEQHGYWCDIGSVESYYHCCFRAAGKVRNVLFGSAATAADSALEGCILFDGAEACSGSSAYGSIFCENVRIAPHSFVGEGCVIGAGTLVGEGAYISGGTFLKSGLSVEKGARVMKSVVFGEIRKRNIEGGRIAGRYGSYVNGELCLNLGGALSYTAGAGSAIGVMHSGCAEAKALADSILCGVRIYGGRAFDLQEGFESMCAFASKEYGLAFSVMVRVEGTTARLSIFDGDGLYPTGKEERAIEAALSRPVPTAVSAGETVRPDGEDCVGFRYTLALTELAPTLKGTAFCIKEKNAASEYLFAAASKAGAEVSLGESTGGADAIYVSDDGFYAEASFADGGECSFWGLVCIGATLGGEVALPTLAPRFVEEAVLKSGGRPVFYGEADSREREAACRCFWSYDGNALALRVLSAAAQTEKTLSELSAEVPRQIIEAKTVRCEEENKARTIGRLYEKGSAARGGEGVLLNYGEGSVTVVPLVSGGFRLFAEAVSTEAAEELFFKTEKEIKRAESD